MKSSFLIVADRGNVKAYRLEKVVPHRPPRLHLIQALTLVGAHQRLSDTVSDQAGAFGGGEGSDGGSGGGGAGGAGHGRHPSGMAERTNLDRERDKRLAKELATHISSILRQEKPGFWAFAAPTEVHQAVLAELPKETCELIEEKLMADLVKVPPDQLLSHFASAVVGE